MRESARSADMSVRAGRVVRERADQCARDGDSAVLVEVRAVRAERGIERFGVDAADRVRVRRAAGRRFGACEIEELCLREVLADFFVERVAARVAFVAAGLAAERTLEPGLK